MCFAASARSCSHMAYVGAELALSKTGLVGVDAIGSQIQGTLSCYASIAMRNP